jgi:hypothetical protein
VGQPSTFRAIEWLQQLRSYAPQIQVSEHRSVYVQVEPKALFGLPFLLREPSLEALLDNPGHDRDFEGDWTSVVAMCMPK